jgi:hypothetical protein
MARFRDWRMSTSRRGYGPAHQARRRRLAPYVASGAVRCARCGELIAQGADWDLGHTDDRRGYLGPEHAACNRATAPRRALITSRSW